MTLPSISALLVDDHALLRAGIRVLLSTTEHIVLVGEASKAEQGIQLYQQLLPDIVIMDLSMPGIGGLEAIRRILLHDDQAKILVFSVHHEAVFVNRALQAGAKGYITKNSAPSLLIEAINSVVNAEIYIETGLLSHDDIGEPTGDHASVINSFSPREFDVYRLLAQGLTVNAIADQLCLQQKTVSNYATQIKKKLGVQTFTELAHIASSLGLLSHSRM